MNKQQIKSVIGRGVCGTMLPDEFDEFAGGLVGAARDSAYLVLVGGKRPADVARHLGISRQALHLKVRRIRDRQLSTILQSALESDCPCDGCPHRMTCATARLACAVCAQFVHEGMYNPAVRRVPEPGYYNTLFKSDVVSQQRRAAK